MKTTFTQASCLTGAAFLGDATAKQRVIDEFLGDRTVGRIIAGYERVYSGEAVSHGDGSFDVSVG